MKTNNKKRVDDIIWTDNLEISEDTDVCEHENIDQGQCDRCGKLSIDIYDEMYDGAL